MVQEEVYWILLVSYLSDIGLKKNIYALHS